MEATLRSTIRLYAGLLLLGALVSACTNQSGPTGPSFPAGQTGSDASGVFVEVAVHRAAVDVGDRAGITVLVTNFNGLPLEGRHVQLSISNASVGRLDQVDGFTDADGKFVTFLFCNADGASQVTAFVLGGPGGSTNGAGGRLASASGTVTCGSGAPAPPPASTGGTTGGTTGGGTT